MTYHNHESMADALACTERQGKEWVARIHTEEENRAAGEFMLRGFSHYIIDTFPQGVIEALVEWKLIRDDLEAAHRHVWAGGGIEAPDHVRTLLLMEQRVARVVDAHHKEVDEHGGTWGYCAACGWTWPCATYTWLTTERDPNIACWNPMDDDDGAG